MEAEKEVDLSHRQSVGGAAGPQLVRTTRWWGLGVVERRVVSNLEINIILAGLAASWV